jgi:hypothetical protein
MVLPGPAELGEAVNLGGDEVAQGGDLVIGPYGGHPGAGGVDEPAAQVLGLGQTGQGIPEVQGRQKEQELPLHQDTLRPHVDRQESREAAAVGSEKSDSKSGRRPTPSPPRSNARRTSAPTSSPSGS